MNDAEGATLGVPAWFVTYGDLMTLLLAFFVMLVSLRDLKDDRRAARTIGAVQKQFSTASGGVAAAAQPPPLRRTPPHTVDGGARRAAPLGLTLHFAAGTARLGDTERAALADFVADTAGKSQKLEVRAFAVRSEAVEQHGDAWDTAFARGRAVLEQLVAAGVDPRRVRLATAVDAESKDIGDDVRRYRGGGRVELFMLHEFVENADRAASPPTATKIVR